MNQLPLSYHNYLTKYVYEEKQILILGFAHNNDKLICN